jgi:hypothetical protein
MLFAALVMSAGVALVTGGTMAANASSPGVTPSAINPGGLAQHIGPTSDVTGVLKSTTSTNWSGYADTAGSYTSASASWTQPAGTCKSGDQYAAFWVGIDGYSSETVEQTGSEVDCVGKTAEYYAWYEMYPNASVTYSNTVRPGDHFNASVTYTGSNSYSLYIADTTQGWSHNTVQSLSGAPRSSAEVIVEAPCCTFSGGILPLANFGTVNITGSTANGAALGNAGGVTQIIMIDNSGRDKDSVSSLSGGENFSATWLRSN